MRRIFENKKFRVIGNNGSYLIEPKTKSVTYKIVKVDKGETVDTLTVCSSNGAYCFVFMRR